MALNKKSFLHKDSVAGTLVFTLVLCLSCSFMITGTAEVLKDRKLAKQRDEVKRDVLLAANIEFGQGSDFRDVFEARVTPVLVALATGEVTQPDDVLDFDERMAAINPDTSMKPSKDIAKIRSRANQVRVYKIHYVQGATSALVVPFYGKGLWSMIYGYVGLAPDLNTIENIVFYEHGETPGIGDFINDPEWLRQWHGKQLFDDKGKFALKVIKGGAKAGDLHGIDGVSGATMTGRGVQKSLEFWFGAEGYQTLFNTLAAEVQSE